MNDSVIQIPSLGSLQAEPSALLGWVERCLAGRAGAAEAHDANRITRVLSRLLPAIEQASDEPAADFDATLAALESPVAAPGSAADGLRG